MRSVVDAHARPLFINPAEDVQMLIKITHTMEILTIKLSFILFICFQIQINRNFVK